MKDNRFIPKGVFPALVTPFDKNENIDETAFVKLINHVKDSVNGVVIAGTTGESTYLSTQERKNLFKIAVDTIKGKIPVIAGTGLSTTKETIELTKYAKDIGASAALVVTPYYLKPGDKGLYEHFYQIAKNSNFPIILYNIPQTTDSVLSRQVIEDLADIDNIIALKDSSGNLPYTLEILELTKGKIDVIIGHDEVVLPALSAGCSGMILASAQVFPDKWQKLFNHVQKSELAEARKIQMEIQKLARIFCRYGGPLPVKFALKMLGVEVGTTRLPLKLGGALNQELREEIKVELAKIGKLTLENTGEKPQEIELSQRFEDIGLKKEDVSSKGIFCGESKKGTGKEEAYISIVMGKKESPVGYSYAFQLTHPRHGFEALTAILEPNLMVKPATIIVPAVKLANLRQANMIYGPAQSAIGKAVVNAIESNIIKKEMLNDYVIICKLFIHPDTIERNLLYKNCYAAMFDALQMALEGSKC